MLSIGSKYRISKINLSINTTKKLNLKNKTIFPSFDVRVFR